MPCQNRCCAPHNFVAVTDPLGTDCQDSVVPGFETEGGYCTGSLWFNTVTEQWFIGVDDMACNTATWKPLNPLLADLARLKVFLLANAVVPTATLTKLTLNTIAWDTTSSYNNGTYIYTVPTTGIYYIEINAEVRNSTGWEFNDIIDMSIYVNGVDRGGDGVFLFQHSTGAAQVFNRVHVKISLQTQLTAGDTVEVFIYHTNAGNVTFESNHFTYYINELPAYTVLP